MKSSISHLLTTPLSTATSAAAAGSADATYQLPFIHAPAATTNINISRPLSKSTPSFHHHHQHQQSPVSSPKSVSSSPKSDESSEPDAEFDIDLLRSMADNPCCPTCDDQATRKHDKRRWWCKKCNKSFTPCRLPRWSAKTQPVSNSLPQCGRCLHYATRRHDRRRFWCGFCKKPFTQQFTLGVNSHIIYVMENKLNPMDGGANDDASGWYSWQSMSMSNQSFIDDNNNIHASGSRMPEMQSPPKSRDISMINSLLNPIQQQQQSTTCTSTSSSTSTSPSTSPTLTSNNNYNNAIFNGKRFEMESSRMPPMPNKFPKCDDQLRRSTPLSFSMDSHHQQLRHNNSNNTGNQQQPDSIFGTLANLYEIIENDERMSMSNRGQANKVH
ncbi:hypothetical protein SAMD00019534_098770 [Acytostelium subglobosum LB1]|uniref:hypothetical protein n=1 Tax=Acytostelium subglobosum LB1 TaxID=1410327 RepID=UPI000644A714|nr:hypothetical protein SAMD00019534_098770 [Acytostelium subglobosum LB1]GAM26702.1 hypothetical protein SAMD00019534_098770 [Acytostelium subglobosum LB1]|eukprot:XP_012750363.1 hypothetical protein SAMD00019534_098770 [Acytostelium subglobosum LB1]